MGDEVLLILYYSPYISFYAVSLLKIKMYVYIIVLLCEQDLEIIVVMCW